MGYSPWGHKELKTTERLSKLLDIGLCDDYFWI